MKIHENLWYTTTTRPYQDDKSLAYMTYYEDNKAFEKRKSTGLSWSGQKEEDTVIIPNKPISGFEVADWAVRYSTSNKLIRIKDPRGFTVEIPVSNLMEIIKSSTIVNGVIQGDCVWGRNGNHNIIPVGSELYKEAEKVSDKEELTSMVKLVQGDVFIKGGEKFVYIGRGVFTYHLEVWYNPNIVCDYYQRRKLDSLIKTVKVEDTKKVHIYSHFPVKEDGKDIPTNDCVSGKVKLTGEVFDLTGYKPKFDRYHLPIRCFSLKPKLSSGEYIKLVKSTVEFY